jgi:integrase
LFGHVRQRPNLTQVSKRTVQKETLIGYIGVRQGLFLTKNSVGISVGIFRLRTIDLAESQQKGETMLNIKGIENLKPGDKPYKVSDGEGMFLYITPSGAKVWRMAFRFAGKQKELVIGSYPEIGLAVARQKRLEARTLIANGVDPTVAKQEKKLALVAAANAKTFGEWCDEWLDKERAGGNSGKTISGKENRVALLKARFGKTMLADISRDDVLGFLRDFERAGQLETRDRVRANGESIFDYASADDTDNPFRPFKKGKLIEKKSAPRPAVTKPADVAKLFKALAVDRLETRTSEVVTLALRFLSLTAVRVGELVSAEWSDIDLDGALWTIPAEKMKMRREHAVPLSRQALSILRQMRETTGEGTSVFSIAKNSPIHASGLNKRLRFLGYDTGRDHCCHGFRSTFSTLLNGECDLNDVKRWDSDLIELQLAHVDESSVKAIYNRTGALTLIGARAKMMQAWADRIDAMVASGTVVSMVA